jgi:hypothetical protein
MRYTSLITLTVLGCGLLLPAERLAAQTPITSATVRKVINQVGIRRGGSSWKPAQVNDPLSRGDALRTRIKSRSDVQLNDGSLARLGELSVWNFVPGTREQVLQSGTGLFLIRPGQGASRIRTPYGSAGIRGSALFVRVNEETQTTIVGALTNNPDGPMEITTPDGKQVLPINAGQMAIVQNNQVSVVDFDLRTFYRTSTMVEGLDLQGTSGTLSQDPAIAAVQGETIAALGTQSPLSAQDVAASPVLLSRPEHSPVLVPANLGQQDTEKTLTLQEFNRRQNGGGVIVAPPVAAIAAPPAVANPPAAPAATPPATQTPLVPSSPQTVVTTPSPVTGGGGVVPGIGDVRPSPVVGPQLPSTTPGTPIGTPDSTLGGGSAPAQVVNTPPPAAQVVNTPPPAAQVVNTPPPAAQVVNTPAAPVVANTPAAPVVANTPAAPLVTPPAAPSDSNDRPDPTISTSR